MKPARAVAMLAVMYLVAQSIAQAQPQERLEIKGLTPGMTRAEVIAKYPDLRCLDIPTRKGLESCGATRANDHANMSVLQLDTYAGHRPKMYMVLINSGITTSVSVELGTLDFVGVTDAIAQRYGKPKIERSTVHNRMGASFDQETHTWTRGEDTLRARKRGRSVDNMEVVLTSTARIAERIEENKQHAKENSKDL